MTESPPDVEGLGLEDLKRLIAPVLEDNAGLKAENIALREEVARLKGVNPHPPDRLTGSA